MNFYVIDTGLFFDVARRISETCSQDDHVFYLNIAEAEAFPQVEKSVGGGFPEISKINTIPWSIVRPENSVFVFTDVGMEFFSTLLKRNGFNVFAGLDFLEENREASFEIASKLGISVPRQWILKGFRNLDLIRNIESDSGRFAVKVSKLRGTLETRIANDKGDLILYLKTLAKKFGILGDFLHIIIQEYIEGVEVAVTAFFNGFEFIRPFFLNFEHEYGGLGTWVFENDVFDGALLPLCDFFRRLNFRGVVDANCIKRGNHIFLLEYTMRFASPGSRLYNRYIKNFADFICDIACGKDPELVLVPFKYGAYCEGFRDSEAVTEIYYEIPEVSDDRGMIVVDCPVMDVHGKTYALSFFERLITILGWGNSIKDAFDVIRDFSVFPGSWVIKTDIEKVEEDIIRRANKILKEEK